CLALPSNVGADGCVGDFENIGRRAIILLQAHHARVGKLALEVQDISDVRAAPSIDRLIVVADHDDIGMLSTQQLDELILSAVGVLILVDENELEAFAKTAPERFVA